MNFEIICLPLPINAANGWIHGRGLLLGSFPLGAVWCKKVDNRLVWIPTKLLPIPNSNKKIKAWISLNFESLNCK